MVAAWRGGVQRSRAASEVVQHRVVCIKGSGQRPWARRWSAIASVAGVGYGDVAAAAGSAASNKRHSGGGDGGRGAGGRRRCSTRLLGLGQGQADGVGMRRARMCSVSGMR
jgi:hypothetical protein